jgi:hypothetical protein
MARFEHLRFQIMDTSAAIAHQQAARGRGDERAIGLDAVGEWVKAQVQFSFAWRPGVASGCCGWPPILSRS